MVTTLAVSVAAASADALDASMSTTSSAASISSALSSMAASASTTGLLVFLLPLAPCTVAFFTGSSTIAASDVPGDVPLVLGCDSCGSFFPSSAGTYEGGGGGGAAPPEDGDGTRSADGVSVAKDEASTVWWRLASDASSRHIAQVPSTAPHKAKRNVHRERAVVRCGEAGMKIIQRPRDERQLGCGTIGTYIIAAKASFLGPVRLPTWTRYLR